VLARLNRGREEARRVAQSASTSLRFASTHALSLTYFPKWLRTMDATVANSTVELVADHMVACERLMLDGKAQFLLCHDHPAASNLLDRAAFQSVCLGLDVLVPVAAADANGRPQHILPGTPEAPVPHLAYNDKSGLGRIIAAAWARTDRPLFLRPVFTSHLAIALKTLALDGRGVVWSPLSLIADNLAPAGALVRAGDERWDIPIEIHLFRPRARQAAFAEAFWAALSTAGAAKG
jgi:DNA-binding transcriptional LysR family regulator